MYKKIVLFFFQDFDQFLLDFGSDPLPKLAPQPGFHRLSRGVGTKNRSKSNQNHKQIQNQFFCTLESSLGWYLT